MDIYRQWYTREYSSWLRAFARHPKNQGLVTEDDIEEWESKMLDPQEIRAIVQAREPEPRPIAAPIATGRPVDDEPVMKLTREQHYLGQG